MSMNRVSLLSKQLTGNALTAKQAALYERLARSCGLKDDDPLWTAMVVLGHYERLYDAIPAKIEQAADAKAREVRENLERFLRREHVQIAGELAAGVESIVEKSLRDQTRLKLSQSLAFAILMTLTLATCCFAAGALMGHSRAQRTSAIAFAWTATPDGRGAKLLMDGGVVALMRFCQQTGARLTITPKQIALCQRQRRSRTDDIARSEVPKL